MSAGLSYGQNVAFMTVLRYVVKHAVECWAGQYWTKIKPIFDGKSVFDYEFLLKLQQTREEISFISNS